MRKLSKAFVLALWVSLLLVSSVAQAAPSDKACWGQATKVFARMGEMGEHASLLDLISAVILGGLILWHSLIWFGKKLAKF